MNTQRKQALICLILLSFFYTAVQARWPVRAPKGMVVSTHYLASQAGAEILKNGGNAIDAAVATGFVLAVVNPAAGNLGGGGFMVIRLTDGTATTFNYREKAPLAAHEKMYLDDDGKLIRNLNHKGYLSVGVPGTVAGFTKALKRYGTMSIEEVIQPAIRLASEGFPLSYGLVSDFRSQADWFKEYPASAKKFFPSDSSYYQQHDLWKQPDLAATLKRIANEGHDGFYRGKTAEIMETVMKANGGLITQKDMAVYQAQELAPIETAYKNHTLYSMAPPSSGGITLSIMLNILEGYNLEEVGHNSAQYIHYLVEAMRRAYEDRAQHLGDPDFNSEMPVARLVSQEYADDLRATINPQYASKSNPEIFEWAAESEQTTHFCVVDSAGNAVSNTYTLEYGYGSHIVLDGAGFLLNNEMGDFNPWPGHTDSTGLIGTPPNLVRSGKRMLSSMTPSLVTKDGKTFMLIGSPGGRTIINTVLQCILNVVEFDMNIYEAVSAPRIHHQWLPDYIRMERRATTHDSMEKLLSMGHRVKERWVWGRAMGIIIDPDTGTRSGAADPRSPDGAAVGY